jgi:hypothetical protein
VTGVRGFERPRVQWMVIGLCAVLTIMLMAATVRMRTLQDALRKADQVIGVNEKQRQTLERDLARERSAREALALELARVRSGSTSTAGGGAGARSPSTLTLDPLVKRSGSPPEKSIDAPTPDTIVELRLLLPDKARSDLKELQITARDWSTGSVRWTIASVRLGSAVGRPAALAYLTGEMLAPRAYEFVLAPVGEGGPQPDPVAAYELGVTRRAAR